MSEPYKAPQVTQLGSVEKLTQDFDKIGSVDDFLTLLVPELDGTIIVDP
jgi:hypothetical protein